MDGSVCRGLALPSRPRHRSPPGNPEASRKPFPQHKALVSHTRSFSGTGRPQRDLADTAPKAPVQAADQNIQESLNIKPEETIPQGRPPRELLLSQRVQGWTSRRAHAGHLEDRGGSCGSAVSRALGGLNGLESTSLGCVPSLPWPALAAAAHRPQLGLAQRLDLPMPEKRNLLLGFQRGGDVMLSAHIRVHGIPESERAVPFMV